MLLPSHLVFRELRRGSMVSSLERASLALSCRGGLQSAAALFRTYMIIARPVSSLFFVSTPYLLPPISCLSFRLIYLRSYFEFGCWIVNLFEVLPVTPLASASCPSRY
jgi:hypothetical protein